MNYILLPEADAEYWDAVGYYEKQTPGLGRKFDADFVDTMISACDFPLACPEVKPHVRRRLMNIFEYGIFYRIHQNSIVVIAIAHTHRKPDHWEKRLSKYF